MPPGILCLLLIVLALLCVTRAAQRLFDWMGRIADSLAAAPWAAEGVVFLFAGLLGGLPTILNAVPPPSTHDEFAYLLAADTFAHGRLSNPPHKLWEHFETLHETVQPTYMAKFPPGQGLALLVGKVLGKPIVGAWGTTALACAAICWMVRGWFRGRWALVGGLLAATHPLLHWWGQIYWGGSVALLGGALLAGAFARTQVDPRIRWGIVAGIGMGILANSRPFEGALISVILLAILLIQSIPADDAAQRLTRFVLPLGATLAPFAAGMMYYNWRVTGDALTLPYVVHARQYMAAPLLWVQLVPPKRQYRHSRLEQFHMDVEYSEYDRQRTLRGYWKDGIAEKWREITSKWLAPPTLAAALLALPLAMLRRSNPDVRARAAARLAAAICVAFPFLHMLLTPWLRQQYLAPVGGFFFLLIAACLRQGSTWQFRSLPLGAGAARAIVILQFVAVITLIVEMAEVSNPTGAFRDRMVKNLERIPGKHLVIVEYKPGPQHVFEWVYNSAEIDASRVVFARDMGKELNRRLFEYFPDRRWWRLSVAGNHVDLQKLPDPARGFR